jgi:hypothetical protein
LRMGRGGRQQNPQRGEPKPCEPCTMTRSEHGDLIL